MAVKKVDVVEDERKPLQGKATPLVSGGSLTPYSKNVTTNIGTELLGGIQLTEILKSDEKIRDLAILIAERNVVFLRDQDITIDEQKVLVQKLGELTGKPKESKLHVHPRTKPGTQLGDAVLVVANDAAGEKPVEEYLYGDVSKIHATNIHADVMYEPYGTDFAALKLVTVPEEGGDTVFYSGYELYDRLSPELRQTLDGLSAQQDGSFLHEVARKQGFTLREDIERGHPENIGGNLVTTHPLIRTNPVTGWKSVYATPLFTKRINGISKDESDLLLGYLFRQQAENFDIECRFKWRPGSAPGRGDVALWDNRSSYHSATFDVVGKRVGNRVLSIGERAFHDPQSKSRREALGLRTVAVTKYE